MDLQILLFVVAGIVALVAFYFAYQTKDGKLLLLGLFASLASLALLFSRRKDSLPLQPPPPADDSDETHRTAVRIVTEDAEKKIEAIERSDDPDDVADIMRNQS